jgi:hypothetical protein
MMLMGQQVKQLVTGIEIHLITMALHGTKHLLV